jgi:hypothetical protein
MKNLVIGHFVFFIFIAICWVTNIVQFVNCDFEPIGKMEIIKGIGTFIPPASLITVWF